nr:MAG TPA: hypothetical protein [Caudoviricetes sp.]
MTTTATRCFQPLTLPLHAGLKNAGLWQRGTLKSCAPWTQATYATALLIQ